VSAGGPRRAASPLRALAGAAWLLAALPGQARPAEEVAAGPLDEEELTVIAPSRLGRRPERHEGEAVLVVEREELESAGVRTLQEALRHLPGIHLTDEQGNAFQQSLAVRGFTASPVTGLAQGISVFLDGVRVNEPAVEEVNFDLIPLSEVERIELVRGPTAIFGRNTFGGAVHITTRRGGKKLEAEVEAEAASWRRREAHARVAGPLGPLDGYLAAGGFQEGGWRVDGGGKGARVFGKLGMRRGDTDLALSWQSQVDRIQQAGSLPRSLLDQDPRQNYTTGDFFRPALHLATLNARQQLSPEVALTGLAYFRRLDAEQFNSSYLSPDTRLFNHTRTVGGALQLDHQASLGALRHRFSAGAEATQSTVHILVNEEPNPNFALADDGSPLPRLLAALADDQRSAGAFLQEGLRLAEGPLAGLGATLALRWDRIAHDVADSSPSPPKVGEGAAGSGAWTAWVPALGVAWAFAPQALAALSYTEGFRAPAFLELTCADANAPCVGLQAGVAPDATFTNLRAVRSRGLEGSLTAPLAEGLLVTLGAFRVDLRNDIYSVTPPGTTLIYFKNVGPTRRQGVEATLRLRRRLLDVDGTWSMTRATFQSELPTLATPRTGTQVVPRGADLPLSPRHRVDLEARVRPQPWWTLEVGLAWVGAQYFRGDEANEAPRLPAYALARAGVEVRWGPWTASLRLQNLFDTRYQTFGTFATDGRAPGQPVAPFLTPGPPLRAVAGIRWELE
jgi:outer membrane receptor protein involved in Fe transport